MESAQLPTRELTYFLVWPIRTSHIHGCSSRFKARRIIRGKRNGTFYLDCWESTFWFSHLYHEGMGAESATQKSECGEFPACPVVRTQSFHCRGSGSIPCRGTKISQTMLSGQKQTTEEPLIFKRVCVQLNWPSEWRSGLDIQLTPFLALFITGNTKFSLESCFLLSGINRCFSWNTQLTIHFPISWYFCCHPLCLPLHIRLKENI